MRRSEGSVFAIFRHSDLKLYTHGYPGSWNAFPRFQSYANKAAASRQRNKLESEKRRTDEVRVRNGAEPSTEEFSIAEIKVVIEFPDQ